MRRALLGSFLIVLTWAPGAHAGIADRIAATFGAMADDLVKALQPIEGVVLDRDGDRIYLDIGQDAGAQVGQELTVLRKGDPFHHPVAGKGLGRYEDRRGEPRVRE